VEFDTVYCRNLMIKGKGSIIIFDEDTNPVGHFGVDHDLGSVDYECLILVVISILLHTWVRMKKMVK